MSLAQFDPDLIRRYNVNGPRYTSYPTADQFRDGACHGPTGAGNAALRAPNLADDTWLYGGSIEAVTESIANGRAGVMPAFGERLDDTQIKLLVALLTANINAE